LYQVIHRSIELYNSSIESTVYIEMYCTKLYIDSIELYNSSIESTVYIEMLYSTKLYADIL